jgi:hypothetical protein
MTRKRQPAKCCNGCDAPVQAPSGVLCAECLAKLDKKFRALLGDHEQDGGEPTVRGGRRV